MPKERTNPGVLAIIGDNFTAQSLLRLTGTEANYLYDEVHIFSLNSKEQPWINGHTITHNETKFRFYDYSKESANIDSFKEEYMHPVWTPTDFVLGPLEADGEKPLNEFLDGALERFKEVLKKSEEECQALKDDHRRVYSSIIDRLKVIKPGTVINTIKISDIDVQPGGAFFDHLIHSTSPMICDSNEIRESLNSDLEVFETYDDMSGSIFGKSITFDECVENLLEICKNKYSLADSMTERTVSSVLKCQLGLKRLLGDVKSTPSFYESFLDTISYGKLRCLANLLETIGCNSNALIQSTWYEESFINLNMAIAEEYVANFDSSFIANTSKSFQCNKKDTTQDYNLSMAVNAELRLHKQFQDLNLPTLIVQSSKLLGITGFEESFLHADPENKDLAFCKFIGERFQGMNQNSCDMRIGMGSLVESLTSNTSKDYLALHTVPTATFNQISIGKYTYTAALDLAVFLVAAANEFKHYTDEQEGTIIFDYARENKNKSMIPSASNVIPEHLSAIQILAFISYFTKHSPSLETYLNASKYPSIIPKFIRRFACKLSLKVFNANSNYDIIRKVLSEVDTVQDLDAATELVLHCCYEASIDLINHKDSLGRKFIKLFTPKANDSYKHQVVYYHNSEPDSNPVSDEAMIYSRYERLARDFATELAHTHSNYSGNVDDVCIHNQELTFSTVLLGLTENLLKPRK